MCSLTSLLYSGVIIGGCPTLPGCFDAGWWGSPSSESLFDQSLGLGLIFPLLSLLIALVSMFCFALYTHVVIPNKVAMISVSVISAYHESGTHINVVQRDLSIISYPSPEQDSRLGIHSPLFLSPYSIPLLSVALSKCPQNFSLCIFSP